MKDLAHLHQKQNSMYRKGLILSLVFLLVTLGVAACSAPSPQPTQVNTPTQLPDNTPTEPPATPPTPAPTYIPVVDPGGPLAPVVVERIPAGGQTVSPKGPVVLTFDQPMDANTIKTALLVSEVNSADGKTEAVPGQVELADAKQVRFTPASPFKAGARYFLTLSDQAASSQGKTLKEAYSFNFVTAQPIAVAQVVPAAGSSAVALNAAITVAFNRPVVPLVVAEQQNTLPQPVLIDPPIQGKGEWLNTSTYVFHPSGNLQGGVAYTVSVIAGLQDAQKESSLAEAYQWSFTTAMPSLEGFSFTDYAWENYPMPKNSVKLQQSFFLRFRQAMDHPSTEANVKITSNSGESVPLTFDWRENDTQLVFTPTVRMALDTGYNLHMSKDAQVAGGGAGLDYDFNYNFKTVSFPGILNTAPSNGENRSQFDTTFSIFFASPMKFDTWKDKVKITPEPPAGWSWYYSSDDYYSEQWTLSMSGLESSTQYTVEIQPGLEDLYGNLTQTGKTVTFKTGPYPPTAYFQMPEGMVLYRASGAQNFYVGLRNVSRATVRLYSLPLKTYTSLYDYKSGVNEYNYTPPAENLIWQESITLNAETDQRTLRQFKPAASGKDRLEPGLYYLTLTAPQVELYGSPFIDHRIVMVAQSNLSLKVSPSEALAWLTDLQDGKPEANVPVVFYDYTLKEIGRATSDADGIARIDSLKYDPNGNNLVYAAVSDPANFAFVSSGWVSGVSPYDFGIWQDYYSRPNTERVYLYTDRPLYRPGQPVYYKGIVRLDDDGHYTLPDSGQIRVRITSFDNKVVYSDTLPVNEFGSFNSKFEINQNAALGTYTINTYPVFGDGKSLDESNGGLSFNVAEYKKPEFIVDVSGSPQKAQDGETIDFTVQADYYSGGALPGADVYWNLQSQPFSYTPPDVYSAYSFTDAEWDISFDQIGIQQPANSLAEGRAKTDDQGKAVVSVPASLGDKGASQTLVLESGVTDFAGVSVYGRSEVVVHRSQVYPGIRSQAYVAEAKKPATFDLVALDWDGKPIANQMVTVNAVERVWNNVQSVDTDGRIKWESTVNEVPVSGAADVKLDGNAKGQFSFTPDHGGVYRVKITSLDVKGNQGSASAYVWVAGPEYIPWRQANNKGFDLVKDKTQYNPGDVASILIASPFNHPTYALVTVERGHVRMADVVRLTTNSTVYRLPVTEDMAPGVYVSVLIIDSTPDAPPDFRMGLSELKVNPSAQTLTVKLEADAPQTSPGETVNYTVHVSDSNGKPVQAEVSLSLSDLAALNLAEANSGPILDFFYYKRNLSVTTSIPLVYSVEDYNAQLARDATALGLGMGSGGGKGAGEEGIIPVRGRFLDTAYWQADLVTGADGSAKAAVTLPDNLTTWRMDARAVTQNTLAGQAQMDLISTRPLLVRPQTPRFFTVGDEVSVGAAVHNNTGMPLDLTVELHAQGVTLLDPVSQKISLKDGTQGYVTWRVQVSPDADRVDMVFSAAGGAFSDASRPPLGTLENQGLPVYRYETPETVGTSGQMLESGTLVESLLLPQGWDIKKAALDIQIAPTLAAGMTDGLTYLENYPYDSIEATISSFLPNVAATRALHDAGLSKPELEAKLQEEVNQSLQKIASQQNPDGGWGWWSRQKSDQITSAYVVLGMAEAKEASYAVDESTLAAGVGYLNDQTQLSLDGTKTDPSILNRQMFMLYSLGRAGSPKTSSLSQMYDNYRQDLAIYAKALLAESIYRQDTGDARLKTLLSDLSTAAMMSATGTHWQENLPDAFNWNTDVRTTAIVLEALSQIDPKNPLNANATRWLMSHRSSGHWANSQETAWTLLALSRWMANSGELKADYDYAVAFNGQTIGGGQANADNLRQAAELSVDVTQMLKDQQNRLAIARSGGGGNLYYTAHLNVFLPVEQVQALDQGIQVQRQYFRPTDLNKPVTQVAQGELLVVRLTVSSAEALHNLIIDDPLPAGLEAIDTTLKTSPTPEIPLGYNPGTDYWGWWYFDHLEMHDEKVVLSSSYLPEGSYTYTYMVRASTPGVFRVVPTTAQEIYFPEVYGRGAGSQFTINP